MKTNPKTQTPPYTKKGEKEPKLSWSVLKVLVTMNHERLEVRVARVWVQDRDRTGRISVAITQVREPMPAIDLALESVGINQFRLRTRNKLISKLWKVYRCCTPR